MVSLEIEIKYSDSIIEMLDRCYELKKILNAQSINITTIFSMIKMGYIALGGLG